MSSFAFGSLLGRRTLASAGHATLTDAQPGDKTSTMDAGAGTKTVSAAKTGFASPPPATSETSGDGPADYWHAALSALVPAEVLAIYGVVAGLDEQATVPAWLLWSLIILAAGLTLVSQQIQAPGALRHWAAWAGAAIAAGAFALWTLLQPVSVLATVGIEMTPRDRTAIALLGAVVLGLAAGLLARHLQSTPSPVRSTARRAAGTR